MSESAEPQKVSVYRRPLPGDPTKISRMGSGKLGAKETGAAGGGSTSTMVILSQEPAAAIAREMGCTLEHALKFMMAFGRVSQRMLLTGKPVGIPHMGILVLGEKKMVSMNRLALAKMIRNGNGRGRASLAELERRGDTIEKILEVRFIAPRSMHRFFMDNAVYNGHWRLHFIEACHGAKHITRAKANVQHRAGPTHKLNVPPPPDIISP